MRLPKYRSLGIRVAGVLLLLPALAWCGINCWTLVGAEPSLTLGIAVHPLHPDTILLATADVLSEQRMQGGIFRTTDHGLSWDTVGFYPGLVQDVKYSLLNPEEIWSAVYFQGFWRSIDGGHTWQDRTANIYIGGANWLGAVSVSPSPFQPDHVLCAVKSEFTSLGHLYRTTNGGDAWTTLALDPYTPFTKVAYDLHDPAFAYAMCFFFGSFWQSADSGASFQVIPVPNTMPDSTDYLSDFAVDPNRPGWVWGVSDFSVYHSTDFGQSWTLDTSPFDPELDRGRHICLVPGRPGTVVVRGWLVYVSTDDGNHWQTLAPDSGSPLQMVGALGVVSSSPLEIWASYGYGGVYSWTVTDTAITAPTPVNALPRAFALRNGFPNPFNATTVIPFALPQTAQVSLKVYDVLGREAALLVDRRMNAGEQRVTWNAEGLASGMYFVRLQAGDQMAVKKVLLVR